MAASHARFSAVLVRAQQRESVRQRQAQRRVYSPPESHNQPQSRNQNPTSAQIRPGEPVRTQPSMVVPARPPYTGRDSGARRPVAPPPGVFPPGHLGSWLNLHGNLPVQGQEQLLRNDPSFQRLPASDQQRLMRQLQEVNQLPVQQRERRLERAEIIEHMNPLQRMQLYQSARELSGLSPARQALVKRAFRDLRGVPLDQRATVLNSQRYQSQFTPQERSILTNLLRAEPYQPPGGR